MVENDANHSMKMTDILFYVAYSLDRWKYSLKAHWSTLQLCLFVPFFK